MHDPHLQNYIPFTTPPIHELTIVIPILNEHDNIKPLVNRISIALGRTPWEVIFVDDDSQDGSADVVRTLARQDTRIRCLQRVGRRGLSTACIEGVLASSSPYIAIMDGDLQHDEKLLPHMLEVLRKEQIDVVIGSRYTAGGRVDNGFSRNRARTSSFAIILSRLICKVDISDPMSGFFMFHREVFEKTMRNLSGQGFKILLDFLASSPEPLKIRELPFEFRKRLYGQSKFDVMIMWEYGMLLVDKMIGHLIPVRFILFCFVGGLGLLVHLVTLWVGLALSLSFIAAQTIGTLVAMTSNFLLNNIFTYHDRRLRGFGLVRGLISFYIICAIGAVANVGIANYIFLTDKSWWGAGIAGAVIGAVWNYAVSSTMTWKK